MDEENAYGKGEDAERPVRPRPHPIYSLRGFSATLQNPDVYGSAFPLGVLVPLYLMPLLFFARYGRSMYCLALTLTFWATGTLPKPATALINLAAIPLLGLMTAEQVAAQYLSIEVLIAALALFVVVVLDSWSELVTRMALGVCERFGIRRGPLFVRVCTCAFMCASVLPSAVVSVTFVYFLDRVFSTIFCEDMDQPPEGVRPTSPMAVSQLPSMQHYGRLHAMQPQRNQMLFDRLADAIGSMKKPERPQTKSITHSMAADKDKIIASWLTGPAADLPTSSQEGELGVTLQDPEHREDGQVATQPASTTDADRAVADAMQGEAVPSEAEHRDTAGGERSRIRNWATVRALLGDEEDGLNLLKLFGLGRRKVEVNKPQEPQPQDQRAQHPEQHRAKFELSPSQTALVETKAERNLWAYSAMSGISRTIRSQKRVTRFGALFRRDNKANTEAQQDEIKTAKDSAATSPHSPFSRPLNLWRKFSLFAGKFGRTQASSPESKKHEENPDLSLSGERIPAIQTAPIRPVSANTEQTGPEERLAPLAEVDHCESARKASTVLKKPSDAIPEQPTLDITYNEVAAGISTSLGAQSLCSAYADSTASGTSTPNTRAPFVYGYDYERKSADLGTGAEESSAQCCLFSPATLNAEISTDWSTTGQGPPVTGSVSMESPCVVAVSPPQQSQFSGLPKAATDVGVGLEARFGEKAYKHVRSEVNMDQPGITPDCLPGKGKARRLEGAEKKAQLRKISNAYRSTGGRREKRSGSKSNSSSRKSSNLHGKESMPANVAELATLRQHTESETSQSGPSARQREPEACKDSETVPSAEEKQPHQANGLTTTIFPEDTKLQRSGNAEFQTPISIARSSDKSRGGSLVNDTPQEEKLMHRNAVQQPLPSKASSGGEMRVVDDKKHNGEERRRYETSQIPKSSVQSYRGSGQRRGKGSRKISKATIMQPGTQSTRGSIEKEKQTMRVLRGGITPKPKSLQDLVGTPDKASTTEEAAVDEEQVSKMLKGGLKPEPIKLQEPLEVLEEGTPREPLTFDKEHAPKVLGGEMTLERTQPYELEENPQEMRTPKPTKTPGPAERSEPIYARELTVVAGAPSVLATPDPEACNVGPESRYRRSDPSPGLLPRPEAASQTGFQKRSSSRTSVSSGHSISVSFRVGLEEPGTKGPVPSEHAPLAPLCSEEAAPGGIPRRKSSILKLPGSSTAGPRKVSVVDFGGVHSAVISFQHKFPEPGYRKRMLRVSMTQSSRRESDHLDPLWRRAMLLNFARPRRYTFDDTPSLSTARRSTMGSQTDEGLSTYFTDKKAKTNSARLDVHNAFLLGPSLMAVLGSVWSFHASSNKRALRLVSVAAEVESRPITGVTWAIVTLPGAALAVATCSVIIWLLYVKSHDPPSLSSANLAVMRAARERNTGRARLTGVKYACVAYAAIFTFAYAPPLLLGAEPRVALLGALTLVVLVTSLVTSCLRQAFEFVGSIWQMLPWEVLLLLGSTQAASKLLQEYDIPARLFKEAASSFWQRHGSLEAQAILALATAFMAEVADKEVLVGLMTPIVVHIAELKRVHPTIYAIPVIVGACCNLIMPASVPLALLHAFARVPFRMLCLLGLVAKLVVVSMAILMVNVMDKAGLLGNETPPE